MAGRLRVKTSTRINRLTRGSGADPDPHPGIGGYTYPRGPYGATGFPGSTSDVRENPEAAEGKLHDDYTGQHPKRRWKNTVTQQRYVIPDSEVTKGPEQGLNPPGTDDTEHRPHLVISEDIPGGERQRNTVYRGGRQAIPGQRKTYRSAPKGGLDITDVDQESRYVFNGVNGGTDTWGDELRERDMPYTGMRGTPHEIPHMDRKGIRNVRGAYLDGERFHQAPDTGVGRQGGAYGRRIRGKERHRPTIFKAPAPWTGKFYDTTDSTGGPNEPGTNHQVREAVHVSAPSRNRRNKGF